MVTAKFGSANGVKLLVALGIILATLGMGVRSGFAAAPNPVYGSATVDGDPSEWNLATDFFANMYRAGKPDKPLESKAYLRYDCTTKTVYVLVLVENGVLGLRQNDDAWVKISGINGNVVDGADGDDGTPPDFAYIEYAPATTNVKGYEASFSLNPGTYEIAIHINVEHGGSQTSATGDGVDRFIPLVIECGTVINPATLTVKKFYDANADGIWNTGDVEITGWKVQVDPGLVRFTPGSYLLNPGPYTVREFMPVETNWIATTQNPVTVTVVSDETKTVTFGNVCLGAGGGKTLGFWSNRNGFATMNDGASVESELLLLRNLNLRNAAGADFDPASYDTFRTWLLGGNATNMAYMLSVQLAAMRLNVEAGLVNGSSLVYAPGVTGANSLGFMSINDLMTAANTSLGLYGSTPSGHAERARQEAMKNALDRGNNNLNFVQPTPCAFSFAP